MRIQVKPKPLRLPEPNPVLVKEVRSRFRGPRGFAALTSFLILLTAFAYLLYRMQIGNMSRSAYYGGYGPGGPANVYAGAAAEIGQAVFATVAVLEMLFMAFIAPALTMNAISSEVERQTYELLLATPLSAWAILRGKVGAALGYVLLLIFSALPVISLAFLFGGVPAVAVAQVQLSVFVSGAALPHDRLVLLQSFQAHLPVGHHGIRYRRCPDRSTGPLAVGGGKGLQAGLRSGAGRGKPDRPDLTLRGDGGGGVRGLDDGWWRE